MVKIKILKFCRYGKKRQTEYTVGQKEKDTQRVRKNNGKKALKENTISLEKDEEKLKRKPFVINTSFGKIITFIRVLFYLFKIKFRENK